MSLYGKDSEEKAEYPAILWFFKKNSVPLVLVYFRYSKWLHKHA